MALKVLVSAFSCLPGRGSESGIGWNIVQQLSQEHQVLVITQLQYRTRIEAELRRNPCPSLHFIYFQLPFIPRYVSDEDVYTNVYYYFWHLTAYFVARRHHQRVNYDVCHHVTWGRYWMPNLTSLLPIPFVWGPLGGGEPTPKVFWEGLGLIGRWQERLRTFARWLGTHDPFLRATAKHTSIGLSTTHATMHRLKQLGVVEVECFPCHVGINQKEFEYLSNLKYPNNNTIRFISLGRLVPWKGIHLSLQAFALAQLKGAEFFVVGDGNDRKRLEALVDELHISDSVRFFSGVSRVEAWQQLEQCQILVHSCLRGSTTTACLEAMAAGRAVIAFNSGQGANTIPSQQAGIMVNATSPALTIVDAAAAMVKLAGDPALREQMGMAAKDLVASTYLWEKSAKVFSDYYRKCIHESEKTSRAL
jgi:glycosyltransferase involved in cell wall biosynthesis